MKIGFVSLGCSKNLVDTENIIGLFDDYLFTYESDLRKCEVIVINTCGFILSAKEESIDTILEYAEYKERYVLKKLIVCGCFVERYLEDCRREFPEVDKFIPIHEYPHLREILTDLFAHEIKYDFGANRKMVNNSYCAYLKIAEGCNNRCAFCAIPLIRGNYRSRTIESLVEEAKMLKENGVRELNVVAQDTTFYGHELYGRYALPDLLKELDKLGFDWIRILYIYPSEITDKLLDTIKASRSILPYFDMPIQSGSDRILKKMRRRDSVHHILDSMERIRSRFDNAIFRTTVITGFPGESDEDFHETLELVKRSRFDSLGAFTFSKEEGTPAEKMNDDVPEEVMKERYDILMSAQQLIVDEKLSSYVGKTFKVLIERNEDIFHRSIGRSYMSAPDGIDGVVYVKEEGLQVGEFYDVDIIGYKGYDLYAVIHEGE